LKPLTISTSVLLILLGLGIIPAYGNDSTEVSPLVAWYHQNYPFISMTDTIYTFESEFITPNGFHRSDSANLTPFQNWVSHFPLWHRYKPVGMWKGQKIFEAKEISRAVHLPWKGSIYKDNAFPLRIIAEYLHYRNRDYDFTVIPPVGDTLNYKMYLHSKVSRTGLGAVKLVSVEPRDSSVYEFFKFLNECMRNTNYASLSANCDSISIDDVAPGDLLIGHDERGRKGVVYVILNRLVNDNGDKLYVVATGCPEACDFHIPLFNDDRNNPWITIEEVQALASEYPYRGFFRWRLKEE